MRFEVEWLDATGIRDRVLAATWARLRISANGADVTELLHLASDTRRAGVYGPVFPLVEWLVENWWHLLYEPSPTSPLESGRGAARWRIPWVQRHNLLAAREGTALPDATFVRDGEDIVVSWFPDTGENELRRVRFVGNGQVRIAVGEFEAAAAGLVESTLQRVSAIVGDNEDLTRVVDAWQAIEAADSEEREICRSLALLGADPYDPEEATESLLDLVHALATDLPMILRTDLLEGSRPDTLPSAASWLAEHRKQLADGPCTRSYPTIQPEWTASAHQTGYRVARQTRAKLLGIGPEERIDRLEELMVERLGWDTDPVRRAASDRTLEGLLGLSVDEKRPVMIEPGSRSDWASRFLLARSAFFTVTDALDQGRLLTRAVTRPQRAARAFAAELLAPASALARRVGGVMSADEVAELSEEFGVSPLLIEHQLENHGLGAVAA